MSLQFSIDDTTRPLVSLSYQSSDEDMEVDSIYSIQDVTTRDSDDDDIQVIARHSENSGIPPQLAAGRALSTDLKGMPELSQPARNGRKCSGKLFYGTVRRVNIVVCGESTPNQCKATATRTSHSTRQSN